MPASVAGALKWAHLALSHVEFRFWLIVAILTSLAIGAIGTILWLRIGIKAFQNMEF